MLKNKISIYVPSTYHTEKAPENVINYYINDTLKKLSALYGGATMTPGKGAYISESGALIMEDVFICYSYCESYDRVDAVAICENLKTVFNQESISLEINNTLDFI